MKLIKAKDVENAIRVHLSNIGFSLSRPKRIGETGCDIIAVQKRQRLLIEVIGFQKHPPLRSREFYESFFRIISRDSKRSGDTLIIALPIRFARGMRQRRKQYGIAWKKLGKTFPNLEIWYVDVTSGIIVKRKWEKCDVGINADVKITKEKNRTIRESVRGIVIREWKNKGKPHWKLKETIDITKRCGQGLFEKGYDRAEAFERAIRNNDSAYIEQWVGGCRFPWLYRR